MNLKIALATALLLTGGTYVSDAQQKTNTAQTAAAITAKSFESKIKEYEKATDAAKSASLLSELKEQMMTGMSTLKAQASSTTDKATQEKLMKKTDTRMNAMNEVIQISRAGVTDKQNVVTALRKYAQTL